MHRSRLLALLLIAFALPLTFAACGGDDDDDGGNGGDDEAQIEEVITTSISSTDPAHCTELQTQAFVEQSEGSTGDAAVQECEADAADTSDDPDSVEVSNITVDGTSGTADVTFTGGLLGGSTASLALVKEGDQWKLDQITDIPTLDLQGFSEGLAASLEEQGEAPPETIACISQAAANADEGQVKAAVLSGDEQQIGALFAECG